MIKYRRMRWAELVLRVGGTQNLVESSEENRLLGRSSQRRRDDIKVDIEERVWGVVGCGLDSCDSGWEQIQCLCEHRNDIWLSTKCTEFLIYIYIYIYIYGKSCFSKESQLH
jgi:hypothetical protein